MAGFDLGTVDIEWRVSSGGQKAHAVSVKGMARFQNRMELFGKVFREKVKNALVAEFKEILKNAVAITPKDTGALRLSGRVLTPSGGGRTVVNVDIVFGGVSRLGKFVDYAEAVHDNPKGFSFKNGEEKFLEKTWARMRPGIEDRIAARVK